MEILEIPVKYSKIFPNFFYEIPERIIYLFFIDRIIVLLLNRTSFVTNKTHSL